MAKVTFVPGSGTLAAYLSGEIDHHAAQTLRREIDAQVDDRLPELLTLDFSGVTFMDSSGVGLILGRGRHVSALGGRLTVVSAAGVLDLLYLAFICGAGYVIWALLMKNNPVSRIAIFGFVNPVVNVLLSALLNGEPLFRWQYMAALVLVCGGIWLVNKAPKEEGV